MRRKNTTTAAVLAWFLLIIPSGVALSDESAKVRLDHAETSTKVESFDTGTATSDIKAYFADKFRLSLSNVYWGEFHTHTKYSVDAVKCVALPPEKAYLYARDQAKLDFVALNDHAEMQNQKAVPKQDANTWESTLRVGELYNDENATDGKVFIIFPGWEYTNTHGLQAWGYGSKQGYGHKNVIFRDLKGGLPANEYGAFNVEAGYLAKDATELWQALAAYRTTGTGRASAFTIVHTPAHVGEGEGDPQDHRTDWQVMDRDFVRHVEIYSKWGGSEGPAPAELGCGGDDPPFEYKSSPEADPLSVRTILYTKWVKAGNAKFQLGFVGGTDNHVGRPGNPATDQCGWEYRGGITGIAAESLTRDKLWTSLWKRHTLAASAGVRMPVLFAVESGGKHLLMGDVGTAKGTVTVRALARTNVDKLEVIVDGCVVPDLSVDGYSLQKNLTLTPGRHYVYIRATMQTDGGTTVKGWTSPVYLKPPAP